MNERPSRCDQRSTAGLRVQTLPTNVPMVATFSNRKAARIMIFPRWVIEISSNNHIAVNFTLEGVRPVHSAVA